MLYDELILGLKRMFEEFTQKYQESVENFSKAYRDLSKILTERDPQLQPYFKTLYLSKL